MFCVSTKSQRGLFVVRPNALLHNGKPCEFAREAMRQTMNLKDRLTELMGGEVPWIQPVLAVPFGFVDGDACGGKVWVLRADVLIDRIAPQDGSKALSGRRLKRVVEALERLEDKAAKSNVSPTRANGS